MTPEAVQALLLTAVPPSVAVRVAKALPREAMATVLEAVAANTKHLRRLAKAIPTDTIMVSTIITNMGDTFSGFVRKSGFRK